MAMEMKWWKRLIIGLFIVVICIAIMMSAVLLIIQGPPGYEYKLLGDDLTILKQKCMEKEGWEFLQIVTIDGNKYLLYRIWREELSEK